MLARKYSIDEKKRTQGVVENKKKNKIKKGLRCCATELNDTQERCDRITHPK